VYPVYESLDSAPVPYNVGGGNPYECDYAHFNFIEAKLYFTNNPEAGPDHIVIPTKPDDRFPSTFYLAS
jgi:hypothetical protein